MKTKNKTKSEIRYIEHRRKLIKEERKLIYERDVINKKLRDIRSSLYSWDNWLVQE